VFHVDDANNVVAFARWSREDEQDAVVVVVNLSHVQHEQYALGLPSAGTWQVFLNTDAAVYSSLFAGGGPMAVEASGEPHPPMPASARFVLPPYSALLLARG